MPSERLLTLEPTSDARHFFSSLLGGQLPRTAQRPQG